MTKILNAAPHYPRGAASEKGDKNEYEKIHNEQIQK